jgi:5-bromo-4-chloroindolyl phosphate hydrolysis protein
MADLIVKDYQQFVSDDLEDMDVEISIAKKNLEHDPDLSTK